MYNNPYYNLRYFCSDAPFMSDGFTNSKVRAMKYLHNRRDNVLALTGGFPHDIQGQKYA